MIVIGTIDAVPALYAGTIVFSIGMSLLFPALFGLVVNRAPASERSHAVGTFSLFFDLSQGAGAPILGLAVDASGTDRAAFLTAAVIAVAGLVMARIRLPKATAPAATTPLPDGTTAPDGLGSTSLDHEVVDLADGAAADRTPGGRDEVDQEPLPR